MLAIRLKRWVGSSAPLLLDKLIQTLPALFTFEGSPIIFPKIPGEIRFMFLQIKVWLQIPISVELIYSELGHLVEFIV